MLVLFYLYNLFIAFGLLSDAQIDVLYNFHDFLNLMLCAVVLYLSFKSLPSNFYALNQFPKSNHLTKSCKLMIPPVY